jgi:putative FmdB family regulatory protein
MPTYDYVCRGCGHAFELFQQMSDAVKRKCPECRALKLERQIGTGAGVIFKGGGFYQTDYRSDSYRKAAEAETKAQKPRDSKDGDAKKPSGESKGKVDAPKSSKPAASKD